MCRPWSAKLLVYVCFCTPLFVSEKLAWTTPWCKQQHTKPDKSKGDMKNIPTGSRPWGWHMLFGISPYCVCIVCMWFYVVLCCVMWLYLFCIVLYCIYCVDMSYMVLSGFIWICLVLSGFIWFYIVVYCAIVFWGGFLWLCII